MLFPARVRVALAGLAVAGGGAVAAALGPAGPAVGQSSQPIQLHIQVSSPATLVARGAGADVTVTASCSGVDVASAQIFVSLAQKSTSAAGRTTVDCTGSNQDVQVVVVPQVGRVLKKGSAIAAATIDACTVDNNFCSSQQAQQTTIQVGA